MLSKIKTENPQSVLVLGQTPENDFLKSRNQASEMILGVGMIPLIVNSAMSDAQLEFAYRISSGMLLIGGQDINSWLYNRIPHPKSGPLDDQRDEFELDWGRKAMKDGKPILGLCRGLQMLWILTGGTLLQHIPDLNLPELHGVDNPTYDLLSDCRFHHKIETIPGTRLHRIEQYMGTSTIVPGMHHQSPEEDSGSSMMVSARSPAGIVEAAEQGTIWGVQFHPEATMRFADPRLAMMIGRSFAVDVSDYASQN